MISFPYQHLYVGKTPAPPSTANAYGHLYQDLDDKGEEEFENTNRILDNYGDDYNDDFEREGIHGDDDSYEKEEDGTNVLPNTPSPTTELQDATWTTLAHENKDINFTDAHRVFKSSSRTERRCPRFNEDRIREHYRAIDQTRDSCECACQKVRACPRAI